MSLPIRVTERATEDAIRIAEYLAEASGYDLSDRFLSATTQAYRRLAEMPGLGSIRDYGDEFPGLRMWRVPQFPRYLIFYQATETELIVRRVLHGAQDIEALFHPPDGG